MGNPYRERVRARMAAEDAYGQLQRHWSSRAYNAIHKVDLYLERWGLDRLTRIYLDAVAPVCNWLDYRQRAFLARWL